MAKKYDYEQLEREGKTDVHVDGEVIKDYSDREITAKYHFTIKNPIGRFFAFIFWCIVALLVPFIVLLTHGTRIRGKRNLRGLKKSGAVVIINHVLYLDCMIGAQCVYPKKLYFHVLENTMKVKGLNIVMKALGAMPIPSKPSAKRAFIEETDKLLAKKKWICVYPEAALWPYYDKIRPFKTGAFHFAVKNNVPIIPICINFRRSRGIFKKFGMRTKFVTVHIGKPLYANPQLEFNDAVNDLLQRSHTVMTRMNHLFKVIDGNVVDENEKWGNRPIFIDSVKKAKAKTETVNFRRRNKPATVSNEDAELYNYDRYLTQEELKCENIEKTSQDIKIEIPNDNLSCVKDGVQSDKIDQSNDDNQK